MLDAIANRRSIRKYKGEPVPRELIEEVLQAGCLAPSAKNRQPWRFIVTAGPAKEALLAAMERGLVREKARPLLPQSARHLPGAAYTLQVMRQAPVVVFVVDPLGMSLTQPLEPEQRVYELCNAQSVGACIENMALAATARGLGSLWICDLYFAYAELKAALGVAQGELAAALALGYAGEAPAPRTRKPLSERTEWRL